MTDRELMCFVNKFRQLLSAGNIAKLVIDCESGCARVNLKAVFQPAHHPHQQQQPQYQAQVQQRAAGPAQQSRRVHRAQAREAAAHQANKEKVRPDIHFPPDPGPVGRDVHHIKLNSFPPPPPTTSS